MTNTPERIWANTVMIADDAHLCGEWNYKSMGRVPDTEYTRTDLYAAAIARAETAEAERDALQAEVRRLRSTLIRAADFIERGDMDRPKPLIRQIRAELHKSHTLTSG